MLEVLLWANKINFAIEFLFSENNFQILFTRSPAVRLLYELMNPDFTHNHKTIFVGRPRIMRMIRSVFTFEFQYEIKKVEVCGFSDASVERYITKQFGDDHRNGVFVSNVDNPPAANCVDADFHQFVNIERTTNNVEDADGDVKDIDVQLAAKPTRQDKGKDILFKIRSSPITDGLSRIPFHAWVSICTAPSYPLVEFLMIFECRVV